MVKEGVMVVPAVRVGVPVAGETAVQLVASSGFGTSEVDRQFAISSGETDTRTASSHRELSSFHEIPE
jgi:hypothetical protein